MAHQVRLLALQESRGMGTYRVLAHRREPSHSVRHQWQTQPLLFGARSMRLVSSAPRRAPLAAVMTPRLFFRLFGRDGDRGDGVTELP